MVMILNLYMVRAVLVALGQEDYGLYTLVAGIVNLLSFLNTTMSGATSRFLTYDSGKGDIRQVNQTLRTAIFLHIAIALALFILAETIGLWFVNAKLTIPENRLWATNVVYQTAIFCMVLRILQVPFNADVLANERMNVYAWIEIGYTIFLVLGVVALNTYKGDRLVGYGILLLVAATINSFSYVLYAKRRLPECYNITPLYKKYLLRPMLAFSGWDLYGNLCASVRVQGVAILLNRFFGPLLNAAAGIAGQIQAAVLAFTSAVTSAFRPQIIKSYSIGDYSRLRRLLGLSMALGVFLFSLIGVPIYFELPYIIKLWLGTPPEYTYELARLMLMASFWGIINSIFIIPIHATGRIRLLSFIGGSFHLLVLPVGYMVLVISPVPTFAYWVNCIMMFVSFLFSFGLLNRMIPELNLKQLFLKDLLPMLLSVVLSLIIPILINLIGLEQGGLKLCITTLIYAPSLASLVYWLKLGALEKKYVKSWIRKKFNYAT